MDNSFLIQEVKNKIAQTLGLGVERINDNLYLMCIVGESGEMYGSK